MLGLMRRSAAGLPQREPYRAPKAAVGCEALEGRALLSRGLGGLGAFGAGGMGSGFRMADLGSFGGGGPGAMFGAGSLGLGGGVKDPTFLLTASLLNTGSGTTTPPSRAVLSSSAVQSVFQTLQTDLKNDTPSGAKPTHASVGQLQDDLAAIRKGTLSGSSAQSKIQSDEASILSSMGLTQTQVTQIQSDLQAVQSAIQSASSSNSSSSTGSSSTTGSSSSTSSTTSSGSSGWSAVQTAMQTLQKDLQSDTPSGAQPTHASVGQVLDDLDAIRKGTLTGTQAQTQVQTDAAAVLASMGLTQAQITTIQSDQQALQAAIQANTSSSTSSSSSTSTSSSSSSSTGSDTAAVMQSVEGWLVGIPGLGGFGMRGLRSSGMAGSMSGPMGFGRMWSRGGF